MTQGGPFLAATPWSHHAGKRQLMAQSLLDGLPGSGDRVWIMPLNWAYALERAKGIEPS